MREATTREYQAKHGHITFKANLGQADPRFWMRLGEAQSKCHHIARVPLQAATARELMNIYFAKGVNATTAIEGNSLTEEEVRARMERQLKLPPSKEYLGIEVDNMVDAYQRVVDDCLAGLWEPLSVSLIRDVNRTVLKNLDHESHVVPGEFRRTSVVVGPYVAPPAGDCEYLLKRMCAWLNGPEFEGPPEDRIAYGFIKAALAHLYLAWIHPFGDGNGRTARWVEFRLLVGAGVPVPAAHVLTSHYNDTRTEYYRQLDRATTSGGDVLPFLRYSAQGFVDGLQAQLEHVYRQQTKLAWQDFVDRHFRPLSGPTAHRQRLLVLALSEAGLWPKGDLRHLSPEVAEAYAGKTTKTITRDVNRVVDMGLVERVAGGRLRARTDVILGLLPPRATG